MNTGKNELQRAMSVQQRPQVSTALGYMTCTLEGGCRSRAPFLLSSDERF
jgi:hypothetical protein